jgi:hypothetical protein
LGNRNFMTRNAEWMKALNPCEYNYYKEIWRREERTCVVMSAAVRPIAVSSTSWSFGRIQELMAR